VKETGRVLRIVDPHIAEVEIRSGSACAKCGICHFDRGGVLSMEAKNDIGASVGDVVEVEIPEGRVILSSLMIFIFPIIAFFGGYLLRGLVSGVICLALYLIFLYFYDKRTKTIPRIARVLSNS
jgi:sigma-E factor negative regulatory protein RseC